MLGIFWHLARFGLRAKWRGDAEAFQFARGLVWELDGRLRDYAAAGPLTLPHVPLQLLIPEDQLAIRVSELCIEDGGTNPYESFCIAAITRYVQPKCVFEIGTYRGQTTGLLARHTPPDARIFTLDLGAEDIGNLAVQPRGGDLKYASKPLVGEHIQQSAERDKITQLLGDSTTFDYSAYRGRCELVFVDAAHRYESVKSDTANGLKMLSPGGVILWHDYKPGCPGVVRALHESGREHKIRHISGTSLALYGLSQRRQTHDAPQPQSEPAQPLNV